MFYSAAFVAVERALWGDEEEKEKMGMKLYVTPDEFVALQELADRATRTIDGKIDESIWIDGVRALFGEPTTTLLMTQHCVVEVLWGDEESVILWA